jgi:hypothetical protein
MKRITTVLGAVAALMIAAAPASAATSATGGSSVTADVANTLEASFPAAYAWGSLNAGATGNESAEQVVNVKSNATWGVKTSTDLVDGKPKEWTGSAYVAITPKVLTNALQWRMSTLGGVAQATSFAAYSSTEALVTGTQPISSDAGTNVGATYKQVVSYADVAAGVTNDYRILANYNVSQGF